MKKDTGILYVSFVIVFLSVLFCGCSKPPTQEIEHAEQTIALAKEKEADLYVEHLYSQAQDSLRQAKELMQGNKYKDALKTAQEAAALALQAISQVEQSKKEMGEETERLILESEKFLEELKILAARAIKSNVSIEREEILSSIGKYEIDMLEIKEQFRTQNIRHAYNQVSKTMTNMQDKKAAIQLAFDVQPQT
jgi:HEPN domain-containing protein